MSATKKTPRPGATADAKRGKGAGLQGNTGAARARKAWRYVIAESGGSLAAQLPPGTSVLDWTYLGREYTWHVYDFAPVSATFGECVGWATGALRDRGTFADGKYNPQP